MVLKLESLSQRLAGHDLVVVGSERTNSRPAVQAPDVMSSERLRAADADRFNPTRYPAIGMPRGGLRAGRSVGSGGSLPSRRLAVRLWCRGPMGRTHQTAKRQGTTARPVV
jgi:hypothetical protein